MSPRPRTDPRGALILGVALLTAAGCNSPERMLDRGDRHRESGDLSRAVEFYRSAGTSTEPEVGGVALQRAAEVLHSTDPTAAETSCEEAVARFPASDPAASCLLLIADLRRERLDWWGAIDAYRELLSQRADDPSCQDIRHEIARCYVELGDPGQALVEWTELLERYPDGPRAAAALLGVARCHDLAGDSGLALTVYQRVRERFPGTPEAVEALVGEAGCVEMRGDLDGAEALYRQALADHPNTAMVERRLELLQRSRTIRLPASP
jgi:tetratricopeptide (TPR) repeat protein